MNDPKEEIARYIGDRTKNLTNDSNTFLWVRTEHYNALENAPEIGGGNLLIAIGLFAALNHLAKIYSLLKGGKFVTKEEAENAKRSHREMDKQTRNLMRPKREGEMNETEAFKKLVMESPAANLGIRQGDLEKVYDAFRNKLTHMVAPRAGDIVLTFVPPAEGSGVSYIELKKSIMLRDELAFRYKEDGLLECNVDLLSRDVEKIANWLVDAIENDRFTETNIRNTLSWIRNRLVNSGESNEA